MEQRGVWLVIGVQASGKSTVADLLAGAFDRGVHVRGDTFRRWAVTGWVEPTEDGATPEARRLLDLRYHLSASVADTYADAGFTVVAQDNLYGPDVVTWLRSVRTRPRHLVVLRPSVEVVAERDRRRQQESGKVAYRPGGFTVAGLDSALAATPRLGLWLDTSHQTPRQTVTTILERSAEAGVDVRV